MALPAIFLPDGLWKFLQPDGSVRELKFGQPGDMPLGGDWNGDGFAEIGLFRPSNLTWYLDIDIDGKPDREFQFTGMSTEDVPLAGDWDGDGVATPAYFRPVDSTWHFRNNNTNGGEEWPTIQLGASTDMPLVGDWNGDGRDTIGIYHPGDGQVQLWNDRTGPIVFWGNPKTRPVVGDWAGWGFDSITFVTNGQWFKRFINCNCQPSNLSQPFEFGSSEAIPLAGRWHRSE
jgi:hypothetical protein